MSARIWVCRAWVSLIGLTISGSRIIAMVQVDVRSHPIFRREGDNLYQELALEFVDAILGTDIRWAAVCLHACAIVHAAGPGGHAQRCSASIRRLLAWQAALSGMIVPSILWSWAQLLMGISLLGILLQTNFVRSRPRCLHVSWLLPLKPRRDVSAALTIQHTAGCHC